VDETFLLSRLGALHIPVRGPKLRGLPQHLWGFSKWSVTDYELNLTQFDRAIQIKFYNIIMPSFMVFFMLSYTITGQDSLSYGQVAEILSNEVDKRISYVDISEDSRRGMKQIGMEDWLIDTMRLFKEVWIFMNILDRISKGKRGI
jgi:hypothetical protein